MDEEQGAVVESSEVEETKPVESQPVEPQPEKIEKPINLSPGAEKLRSWLNKCLRIQMTDGRVLIGSFLCTDRDANVILAACSEYLSADSTETSEEPRLLGLVMVPGKHIVSVHLDASGDLSKPIPKILNNEDVM